MEKEDYTKLEEIRETMAKLTADRDVFMNLFEAYEKQDVDRFKDILDKFKIPPPICHFVCWWICWVECRIRCERVCKILCPYPPFEHK